MENKVARLDISKDIEDFTNVLLQSIKLRLN